MTTAMYVKNLPVYNCV